MKESEDAGENKQPMNLQGRKQNNRTTINNQPPGAMLMPVKAQTTNLQQHAIWGSQQL